MPPMAILVWLLISIAISKSLMTLLGIPKSFGNDGTQIRQLLQVKPRRPTQVAVNAVPGPDHLQLVPKRHGLFGSQEQMRHDGPERVRDVVRACLLDQLREAGEAAVPAELLLDEGAVHEVVEDSGPVARPGLVRGALPDEHHLPPRLLVPYRPVCYVGHQAPNQRPRDNADRRGG